MKILRNSILLLLFFVIKGAYTQDIGDYKKPQTLEELQTAIQKVLKETETPGAGVVMLAGDSVLMLRGFGKADVEKNIAVNENTIFRLGSISKVFVALAILKLQEEGYLHLKDKIRDIIPEIEFNNPWKKKHPILIEHLLEHTSGWSYWHFAELGNDDPKPKTLQEALDFYPKSRVSTFVPGTRMRESNVGSAVAAYIVEKISGMSFEDYVDKYLFEPMRIKDMSYLYTEKYKKRGVRLYDNGVKLDYFHILYRPAASLNGTPKDMAKLLQFFLKRGDQILTDSSLRRMERNESMGSLSKLQLFKDSGLSNNAAYYKGFTYREYEGSVPGGNARFAYLPEYNLGYAVTVNASNEKSAIYKISELIKYYQTKDLPRKAKKTSLKKYKLTTDPSGYYTIIDPKIDKFDFIQRIKFVHKVWIKNDTLFVQNLFKGKASTIKYIAVSNNEFHSVESERITLTLINDPLEGQIIVPGFLKKISPLWAYTLVFIIWAFFIILFTTVLFAFIWLMIYLFGKKKNKTALWISLLPFITNSILFISFFSILLSAPSRYGKFQLFGTVNPISILLFICGICYALFSIWSVYYIFKNRGVKMASLFYFHSAIAAVLNLGFMLYLLSSGLIGIPTWI